MRIYGKGKKSPKLNWILLLSLLALLVICSSACTPTTYSGCPPYPVGGKKVADEVQRSCLSQDTKENLCPHLFLWLDKIGKLQKQLEACQ